MSKIEELLKSMQTRYSKDGATKETANLKKLLNSKETWARIGAQDSFMELEFKSETEKEAFLKDFMENNPYSNI